MKLVIFGYGNPSRGDDAIGPLLLERIEEMQLPNVTCIEDFQLQLEHALDLEGQEIALFIDAGTGTPSPFSFTKINPSGEITHTTHALAPEKVLDVFVKIKNKQPPPAFLLCVEGISFCLGGELSPKALSNINEAWKFLQNILSNIEVKYWQEAYKISESI